MQFNSLHLHLALSLLIIEINLNAIKFAYTLYTPTLSIEPQSEEKKKKKTTQKKGKTFYTPNEHTERWGGVHARFFFLNIIIIVLSHIYVILHFVSTLIERIAKINSNSDDRLTMKIYNIKRIKFYILRAHILVKSSTYNVFVMPNRFARAQLSSNHWHLDVNAAQRSTKHDTLTDLLCMPSSWHLYSSSEH